VITGNSAECGGGIGIWSYYSYPIIEENTISGNTATYGGGIWCDDGLSTVRGNVITGNSAADDGGGIYALNSSYLNVEMNTFSANIADDGGAIFLVGYSGVTVHNTIIYGDTTLTGNEMALDYTSAAYVSYSDVEGGWSGTGNIDQPPLFTDPSQDDYTLSYASPCIDRGDPSSPVPRGGACVCDMGAYEYYQGIDCHRDPVESWSNR